MIRLTLLIIGMAGSVALATPTSYTCDSKDEIGTKSRTVIDLSKKEISMIAAGATSQIYDNKTICGWRPTGGLAGINCPFASQVTDGFLSVDLECYRGNDPDANAVTSGSLQIQNGSGSLSCYVYSNLAVRLSLSNCRGQ